MLVFIVLCCLTLAAARAGKPEDNFKGQHCIDPRTSRKHAAYSEWADAYSCSRHRCQPGGRNLAIYTVGCKRVEAPESAIECEEVVEDTNMQFPYCCTRLRCLVLVRGEVWTRVLGQPWETLPAAPWSHMYKMKKPPPSDDTVIPKQAEQGPIYELQTDAAEEHEKVMRAAKAKQTGKNKEDCKDTAKPYAPSPDIVIALTTGNDENDVKKIENPRLKATSVKAKESTSDDTFEKEREADAEETGRRDDVSEKAPEMSEEKFYSNILDVTKKAPIKTQNAWSEIPQAQWNDRDSITDDEVTQQQPPEEKHEKAGLQALVDAIGNRMKDIEDVVQRMSEKVVPKTPEHAESAEKRKKHVTEEKAQGKEKRKPKKPNSDSDNYKRFTVKNRSKYIRSSVDVTSELPLYVEDANINGYFSDASNSVLRRANTLKEHSLTYMAPVESRRRPRVPESSETEKKHKKHSHRRRNRKGKGHKKHHSKDDKKHFNKISSVEIEKNAISLEDSSGIISK